MQECIVRHRLYWGNFIRKKFITCVNSFHLTLTYTGKLLKRRSVKVSILKAMVSPPVCAVEPALLIIYLHDVLCLLCVFYLLSIRYLLGSTWRSTYTGCSVKEIEIIYYLLQNELDYYTDTTANNTATIDTTATTDTTCTTKTAATSARTAAATTSTTDTTYTTVTSASTASTGENVTEFYVSLVSFFPRCWLELYRQ